MKVQELATVRIDLRLEYLTVVGPEVCFIYDLESKCYTGIVDHQMCEKRINLISLSAEDIEAQAVKLLKLAFPSYTGNCKVDEINKNEAYKGWQEKGKEYFRELEAEFASLNKSIQEMNTEERRLYDAKWRKKGWYKPYGYDKPVEIGGSCDECEHSNGNHASYCGRID